MARHARTCGTDRGDTGRLERSRRRNEGGATRSCQHRLRDLPEALLVVTARGLQDGGAPRTLTNDWEMLRETNPAKKPHFDSVVANPPFSYRWEPNEAIGEDVRFKNH